MANSLSPAQVIGCVERGTNRKREKTPKNVAPNSKAPNPGGGEKYPRGRSTPAPGDGIPNALEKTPGGVKPPGAKMPPQDFAPWGKILTKTLTLCPFGKLPQFPPKSPKPHLREVMEPLSCRKGKWSKNCCPLLGLLPWAFWEMLWKIPNLLAQDPLSLW